MGYEDLIRNVETGDRVKVTYQSNRSGNSVTRRGKVSDITRHGIEIADIDHNNMTVVVPKVFNDSSTPEVFSRSGRPFSGRTTRLGPLESFERWD